MNLSSLDWISENRQDLMFNLSCHLISTLSLLVSIKALKVHVKSRAWLLETFCICFILFITNVFFTPPNCIFFIKTEHFNRHAVVPQCLWLTHFPTMQWALRQNLATQRALLSCSRNPAVTLVLSKITHFSTLFSTLCRRHLTFNTTVLIRERRKRLKSGVWGVAAGLSLEMSYTASKKTSANFLIDASLLYKDTCPELSRFLL